MTFDVYEIDSLIWSTRELDKFAKNYVSIAKDLNLVSSANPLICKNKMFKHAEKEFYKYELDAATLSYSKHYNIMRIADSLREEQFKKMTIILWDAFVTEITKGSGSVRLNEYEYRVHYE